VCCTAQPNCGVPGQCCFNVYVLFESPFVDNLVPPPVSQYLGPPNLVVTFPTKFNPSPLRLTRPILINRPPSTPPPNALVDSFFDIFVDVDFGSSHQVLSGECTLRESPTLQSGPRQTIPTEMIALSLNGLPPGTMIRESPTLQSTGQTTVRPVSGGYMIGSFFDVFLELSTDNGSNWTPADRALRCVLGAEPSPIDAVDPNLPPPGRFVSAPDVTTTFVVPGRPPLTEEHLSWRMDCYYPAARCRP